MPARKRQFGPSVATVNAAIEAHIAQNGPGPPCAWPPRRGRGSGFPCASLLAGCGPA